MYEKRQYIHIIHGFGKFGFPSEEEEVLKDAKIDLGDFIIADLS